MASTKRTSKGRSSKQHATASLPPATPISNIMPTCSEIASAPPNMPSSSEVSMPLPTVNPPASATSILLQEAAASLATLDSSDAFLAPDEQADITEIQLLSQSIGSEAIAGEADITNDEVATSDAAIGEGTGNDFADGVVYSDACPISLSLLNAMDPALIAGRKLLATVDFSQPHITNKMKDGAKYWLTDAGEVLVVRLPCLVDATAQGVRIGKYFDLYGEEITDDKFKKLRAIFGFRSLPDDSDAYPPEVLKAASAAQKLLYKLQTRHEADAIRHQQQASTVRGCYKADMAQDCFQYLIRSEPIFTPAADPAGGASGVPAIDLTGDTDSDSGSDLVFASPSKLRAQAAAKSAATKTPQDRAPGYTLGDWAQPAHACSRYYHLVGDRTHLWASRFNIPDIRNQNGAVVHPTEWDTALAHLTPVTVDFVLKLWDIPAGRSREGSRIYQLVLRKVQIHPVNTLSSCIVHPTPGKGKRRAAGTSMEDGILDGVAYPPSPTKKSKSSSRANAGNEDIVMGM